MDITFRCRSAALSGRVRRKHTRFPTAPGNMTQDALQMSCINRISLPARRTRRAPGNTADPLLGRPSTRGGPRAGRNERGEPRWPAFASGQDASRGRSEQRWAFIGPGLSVAVGYRSSATGRLARGGSNSATATVGCVLSKRDASSLQSLCTRLGVGAGSDWAGPSATPFRDGSCHYGCRRKSAITAPISRSDRHAIGINILFHIRSSSGDQSRGECVSSSERCSVRLSLIEAFLVAMRACRGLRCRYRSRCPIPDWGAGSELCADHGSSPTAIVYCCKWRRILGATVMPA